MVIKITPKQSKRINALIKKLCCNYMDGNCLLLLGTDENRVSMSRFLELQSRRNQGFFRVKMQYEIP